MSMIVWSSLICHVQSGDDYSLCLDAVLPEIDFYDRIAIAAELGFEAFEFWDPAGKDIDRIARLAQQNHIAVAICGVLESWGHPVEAPDEAFLAAVRSTVDIAAALDCHSLLALTGPAKGDPAIQTGALIESLKRAAEVVEPLGISLCVEALNTLVDHAGYFLNSARLGFELVGAVGSPQVKLLYDIYHMQIMEGNIIATLNANIAAIGHFHSAGVPGRHELSTGELDYRNIVKAVDAAGYQGYFGLEYWPTYDSRQSLADTLKYLKI
jgi:hydroxypyruvate isomerase